MTALGVPVSFQDGVRHADDGTVAAFFESAVQIPDGELHRQARELESGTSVSVWAASLDGGCSGLVGGGAFFSLLLRRKPSVRAFTAVR